MGVNSFLGSSVIALWEFMDILVGPLGFGFFCYDFNVGASYVIDMKDLCCFNVGI